MQRFVGSKIVKQVLRAFIVHASSRPENVLCMIIDHVLGMVETKALCRQHTVSHIVGQMLGRYQCISIICLKKVLTFPPEIRL